MITCFYLTSYCFENMSSKCPPAREHAWYRHAPLNKLSVRKNQEFEVSREKRSI
jgi:hypothetical protein